MDGAILILASILTTRCQLNCEERGLTSRSAHKHLDGAFGAKIGLHDFIQTFGCIDIHEKGSPSPHHLRLAVQLLYTCHGALVERSQQKSLPRMQVQLFQWPLTQILLQNVLPV